MTPQSERELANAALEAAGYDITDPESGRYTEEGVALSQAFSAYRREGVREALREAAKRVCPSKFGEPHSNCCAEPIHAMLAELEGAYQ